jgi:hypothetical protein
MEAHYMQRLLPFSSSSGYVLDSGWSVKAQRYIEDGDIMFDESLGG